MAGAATTVIGVARGAREDRVSGLAAEVAFFGAMSVLPTLIAIAAALTLVPRLGGTASAGEVESTVVAGLERVLTDRASGVVDEVQQLFDRANGDVFTLALVAALWSGSRGLDAVLRAVVLVSNEADRRPWWKRRLLALGLLLATIVVFAFVLSMFVVGPLLGGAQAVADRFEFGTVFTVAWRFLRIPLVIAVLTGWSLVLLHVGRSSPRRWRSDLPGAAATTILWMVSTLGLRAYLQTVGSMNVALGALGGPLIGLLWLYLLALSLLIGAEVSQHVGDGRRA